MADPGSGREICLEFAARGAAVAVASNQQHEIEEVVATVSADAGIAMACHADVTMSVGQDCSFNP